MWKFNDEEDEENFEPLNRTEEDKENDRKMMAKLEVEIYESKSPEQKLISHIAEHYTDESREFLMDIRRKFSSGSLSLEEAISLMNEQLQK